MRTATASVALFLLAGISACTSPVPATVTQGPLMPITQSPTIALTANLQLPRVEQSLHDAGLRPVDARSANYWLRVDTGSSRANKVCGTTNNVMYTLSQRGQRILVVKGRGDTGTCEPNIYDDMSRLLASYFP